jgi:hypothetical protein
MEVSNKPDAGINLTDLKNMLVFIDLATQRGALRAPELSSVAALYDRINQFVQDTEKKLKTESDKTE